MGCQTVAPTAFLFKRRVALTARWLPRSGASNHPGARERYAAYPTSDRLLVRVPAARTRSLSEVGYAAYRSHAPGDWKLYSWRRNRGCQRDAAFEQTIGGATTVSRQPAWPRSACCPGASPVQPLIRSARPQVRNVRYYKLLLARPEGFRTSDPQIRSLMDTGGRGVDHLWGRPTQPQRRKDETSVQWCPLSCTPVYWTPVGHIPLVLI